MAPIDLDLSDMLESPDSIDLEGFDLHGESPPDAAPIPDYSKEIGGVTQSVQELRDLVSGLHQEMSHLRNAGNLPGGQPDRTATPGWTAPPAPSDAMIQEAVANGDIVKAMKLQNQQFTINNFMPAIAKLIEHQDRGSGEAAVKTGTTMDHLAVGALQQALMADPALEPLRKDIIDTVRQNGFSAEQLLQPGVIDSIINQVAGAATRAGTWESPRTVTGLPAGGMSGGSTDSIDPRVASIFRAITGVSGDETMIRSLSSPKALQIGREG